jgi:hypothetical protein
MSQDSFLMLLTIFQLNNNNAKAAGGQPGYDTQFKIRPVIDTSQNFRTSTHWKKAIYPFRGCIFFRVSAKEKPHKYGIKVFELCKAKSGYVYNL